MNKTFDLKMRRFFFYHIKLSKLKFIVSEKQEYIVRVICLFEILFQCFFFRPDIAHGVVSCQKSHS